MTRSASSSDRIVSIDALRGLTMLIIIGGDALLRQIAKVFGGDARWAKTIEHHLDHADWHGFTAYDLIFPTFLFVVGAVLPFSLAKQGADGTGSPAGYGRLLRRTITLLALAFIYAGFLKLNYLVRGESGWTLSFERTRFFGVLQRIAICYFFAGLVALNFRAPGRLVICASTLVSYWLIVKYIAAPGGVAGDLTYEGSLASYLDTKYMGWSFLYHGGKDGLLDNEGILSTLPAIGTTLLGVLAGGWLQSGFGPLARFAGLVLFGLASLAGGWAFQEYLGLPINKILWTSSFALWAGGWSMLLLAFFYLVIDVAGWRAWAFPFVVIGANAILIYVLGNTGVFQAMTTFLIGDRPDGGAAVGLAKLSGGYFPLLKVSTTLLLKWLLLWFLYRQRVFLRA
jgi:predicted acyltransferase